MFYLIGVMYVYIPSMDVYNDLLTKPVFIKESINIGNFVISNADQVRLTMLHVALFSNAVSENIQHRR